MPGPPPRARDACEIRRNARISRARRCSFITRVREAFPAGGEPLDSDAVLARLERIHPGFAARGRDIGPRP